MSPDRQPHSRAPGALLVASLLKPLGHVFWTQPLSILFPDFSRQTGASPDGGLPGGANAQVNTPTIEGKGKTEQQDVGVLLVGWELEIWALENEVYQDSGLDLGKIWLVQKSLKNYHCYSASHTVTTDQTHTGSTPYIPRDCREWVAAAMQSVAPTGNFYWGTMPCLHRNQGTRFTLFTSTEPRTLVSDILRPNISHELLF